MAIDLTGIQNVGEFYSHHYLDALLEGDLKALFAQWRADDERTPDRRLNGCAGEYFAAKQQAGEARDEAAAFPAAHAFHVALMQALGYGHTPGVRYLLDGGAVPVLGAVARDGHPYLVLVETHFPAPDQSPLGHALLPRQLAAATGEKELSALDALMPAGLWEDLIGELLRVDEPPRWIVLLAGRFVYLFDRTKWGQGQYLLFDLDEIFGRRESSTLRAVAALLSSDALCPIEGIPLHDTLDENSHKHAYAVSSDLKYGARHAVELLANEYVWYMRNERKRALFQDDALARKLTDETLTWLYRLLFLFYAEARGGELDLVPMKSEAYRTGYSLEMLRDLEQVRLDTPQAQNGYFIHESLTQLFALMHRGYAPGQLALLAGQEGGAESELFDNHGFRIEGLQGNLFDAARTPLLSSVKFRNVVLQEVIQALSLSKEGKGRNSQRGRISYAQLGINQLGAVYEGLLSYTGFFARETLYPVKTAGADAEDEKTQIYFISAGQLDRYTSDEFIYEEGPNGVRQRKQIAKGTFVYRLAGRDREKSASYYTPEVLTQCVVKYSLKELLPGLSADDILDLRVCEPAMGSGAFINEALNQLADAYLGRKQEELDRRIAPDQYREERQRVKAHLAGHNVYGVDLNPTAVELATVSIWLNTIHRAAGAPWYAARLAVGNSLIGARRQVYTAEDVRSGAYAALAPTPAPLRGPRPKGSVYHFLLPDKGMAAFDSDKVIKELAPDAVAAIKQWRKEFTRKIDGAELKLLQALSDRVDELWTEHAQARQRLLARTHTPVAVWGQEERGAARETLSVAARDRALAELAAPTAAGRRLKLAMDYWCALWFWPLAEAGQLPERADFLRDLETILRSGDEGFKLLAEQLALYAASAPEAEEDAAAPALVSDPEQLRRAALDDLKLSDTDALVAEIDRLALVNDVARQQRFHHWEVAFAEVFAERGGFDLVLGNPPWVPIYFDQGGALTDYEPQISVRGWSSSQIANAAPDILTTQPDALPGYLQEFIGQTGSKSYLGATANYPLLAGKLNSYKCFLPKAWEIGSPARGVAAYLHPEGVYDDPKGGPLRAAVYPRLAAHFQFHNELNLFAEVDHHVTYSVNVYRPRSNTVGFSHIVNLFHPSTIDRCFAHDGSGVVPGMRDDNDNWEVSGHARRIVHIDTERLRLFANLYDTEGTLALQARLPSVHSEQVVSVLAKFSNQPMTLGQMSDRYYASQFWNETNSQKDGTIRRETRFPRDMTEWIVSGPHFHVATPLNKTPNEECKHNLDYSDIDLTAIPDDYLPRTNYVPACAPAEYQRRIPRWNGEPITKFYRHVHRRMLSQTGERTLINALIPAGVGHTNTVISLCFESNADLARFSGFCSTIVYDFFVKSTGKGDLYEDLTALLPFPEATNVSAALISRTLRLNCLTTHYAALWEELYDPAFAADGWAKADARLAPWVGLTPQWRRDVALRTPFERRQALVEIDVLAALALGLTLDELLTIYRVQFPVLQKYERRMHFDQRGMEVPMKTSGGTLGVDESKPEFAAMVPPFTPVDREADYREAWAVFAARLG